ncbi:polysaccharide biosynthesis C-terminal domain-containing protein [Pseudobutyrivibrio xylanivorans]|uniref:Membrane protein involved in the export of O-antigen and teichoic acid n=1 Tax=Pseudobutyrivibrio xylanivorans TaxID=185007 RepID=A0A5P6VV66_PSEXY|nr:hypothetical protein [Pseudobutyrivibrio xylanivorans]QFJ56292.1 hypothetical protein FXF36_15350 [Pseudobutyrivibrio xylanivorans]
MRKKKTIKNIIFGFGTQVIIIVLGLFIPRLVMLNYGSDTNGYTATIQQIFTYMALMEAGIGQSTLNSLYEPFAKKDKLSVSQRMSASRAYYRKVTRWYALLVVAMSVVLPFVLNTSIDKVVAGSVVFFEGMSAVICFYYFACWKQLLQADGRYYVVQVITMINSVLGYAIKIILVYMSVNIGIIQFAFFILSLVQLLIYKIYTQRHYPWVDFNAKPDPIALKDRKAFMVSQIATTIFSSTDMIVLSIIGSTALASVYSIYGLIFNNLLKILNALYFGVVFLLGQMWQKDKKEYVYLHDAFDVGSHWLITSSMSVAYIMTIPFISLYTKGVEDVQYIYASLPLLFCLVQIFSWNRYVSGNLTAIAGYAKPVSKVSAIEAFLNLSLSIILGIKFGIVGVLFATMIALPVKIIYCLFLSNTVILKRSIWVSTKIILTNYIMFGLCVLYTHLNPVKVDSFKSFALDTIIVCLIIYPLFAVLNVLCSPSLVKHYYPRVMARIRQK